MLIRPNNVLAKILMFTHRLATQFLNQNCFHPSRIDVFYLHFLFHRYSQEAKRQESPPSQQKYQVTSAWGIAACRWGKTNLTARESEREKNNKFKRGLSTLLKIFWICRLRVSQTQTKSLFIWIRSTGRVGFRYFAMPFFPLQIFKPLTPKISLVILLTVYHIVLVMLA